MQEAFTFLKPVALWFGAVVFAAIITALVTRYVNDWIDKHKSSN